MIAPIPYSLSPTFFAGAPNEDLIQGPGAMNQLDMRMASSGLLEMYTDTLYFDVMNSYEVARCVRGQTINGQPDYWSTAPLPLTLATAANPKPTTLWCDWTRDGLHATAARPTPPSPGAPDAGASLDGGMSMMASAPRIHLTPYTDVHRVALALPDLPGRERGGRGDRRLDRVSELRRRRGVRTFRRTSATRCRRTS